VNAGGASLHPGDPLARIEARLRGIEATVVLIHKLLQPTDPRVLPRRPGGPDDPLREQHRRRGSLRSIKGGVS
jgi:hypothetical protein